VSASQQETVNRKKPLIGVSQCLLGDAVRYDGQSKSNQIIRQQLSQLFELLPVCPEVEAGLSVPRPPIQLTSSIINPKITGRDDPALDVTETLMAYCNSRPAELKQLAGFIFKSRSPSCGLNSTPVFINGECATATSRGVFAREFCNHYPQLPVIEDSELENRYKLEEFIQSVMAE
jgi:uncharacterized protein YbbK (DUF523 family)